MVGRNFIVNKAENFSERNAKKIRLKILYHYRKIVKKQKDFIQL